MLDYMYILCSLKDLTLLVSLTLVTYNNTILTDVLTMV